MIAGFLANESSGRVMFDREVRVSRTPSNCLSLGFPPQRGRRQSENCREWIFSTDHDQRKVSECAHDMAGQSVSLEDGKSRTAFVSGSLQPHAAAVFRGFRTIAKTAFCV